MSSNVVEIDEGITFVGNMWSRSCYLFNQEGELESLWEMQNVEDFGQTNKGNNEEGKKHLHVGTQHFDKIVRLTVLKKD